LADLFSNTLKRLCCRVLADDNHIVEFRDDGCRMIAERGLNSAASLVAKGAATDFLGGSKADFTGAGKKTNTYERS
jgi:hypothetical protein